VGFDLSVASQNIGGRSAWDTRRDLAACFDVKQVWLGFSQSGLKTSGCTMMGVARGIITEVTLSAS
jgi:hypothetical protein